MTTALAGVGVNGHSRPFFDEKIIVHCPHTLITHGVRCPQHRRPIHKCVRASDPKELGSVESVDAVIGDGLGDLQIPRLNGEAREVELGREADTVDRGRLSAFTICACAVC